MALEMVLPFGKKTDVKNLVFTILIKESPLKIIELTNFIRKRYGRSVSFQGVRKAIFELVEEGVLIKEENEFSINKEWVKEAKTSVDGLYNAIFEGNLSRKEESIMGDVSVFHFNSLNDMMKFWQDLIDDWFRKFKKGDSKINIYQCAHAWEGLLHLDKESSVMGQLKKKGIISYILCTGNTKLDKNIRKFYQKIGVKFVINQSNTSFDRGYYVGTYGDMIVQSQYPLEFVKKLDSFFKKNMTIEELDLSELSSIVNKKIPIKLTVIKNLEMAKQINNSVIAEMQ